MTCRFIAGGEKADHITRAHPDQFLDQPRDLAARLEMRHVADLGKAVNGYEAAQALRLSDGGNAILEIRTPLCEYARRQARAPRVPNRMSRSHGKSGEQIVAERIGQGDVGAEPLDQAVAAIAPGSAAQLAVELCGVVAPLAVGLSNRVTCLACASQRPRSNWRRYS